MKKKFIIILPLLAIILACGRFSNEETISNSEDVPSERIVCIAKQYTEIIFALGAEKDIVAVDISSTFPEAAKLLPTVGYHRALSAEAILSTEPTLIIHDNNIGPENVVTQLDELEIPMKVFDTKGEDIESTKALITEIGTYFNKVDQAKKLCSQLDKEMELALETAKKYSEKPKVLVIHYGQANNVYLVVTANSTAAKIVGWAGGEMAVTGEGRMKHLSAEIVAASDPDVILITDFGFDKLGSHKEIGNLPGISETKAFKEEKVYRVEEHDLIYLGPRTGQTTLMLQKLIHEGKAE